MKAQKKENTEETSQSKDFWTITSRAHKQIRSLFFSMPEWEIEGMRLIVIYSYMVPHG